MGQTSPWKLVWHDEFEGTRLDVSKWVYIVAGDGFGNKELEYYTDRPQNLYLENGLLVIEALKEDYRGAEGLPTGLHLGAHHHQRKICPDLWEI